MFRTLIAGLTVAAVVGIGAMGSAFAAHDDEKNMPGYQCKPKKNSQAGDFQYSGGSIRNRTNSTRKVVCPLMRDSHDADTVAALDQVRIDFKVDNTAVTLGQSFDCTAEVRDTTTSAIFDSATGSETAAGNSSIFFFGLDYAGGSNNSVSVECTVPAKSRVRNVHWGELLDTDGSE